MLFHGFEIILSDLQENNSRKRKTNIAIKQHQDHLRQESLMTLHIILLSKNSTLIAEQICVLFIELDTKNASGRKANRPHHREPQPLFLRVFFHQQQICCCPVLSVRTYRTWQPQEPFPENQ